jgi:hypothetical protein
MRIKSRAQVMRLAALLFTVDVLLALVVMVALMSALYTLGVYDWAYHHGWTVLLALSSGLGYLVGLLTPPARLFVRITFEPGDDDGEA